VRNDGASQRSSNRPSLSGFRDPTTRNLSSGYPSITYWPPSRPGVDSSSSDSASNRTLI
jgi:hypothetical protein